MSYRPISRALALLSLLPALGLALPTSPSIESGGAFLDRVDPATMHITCQDKTVINWDTFSVESHEALKFIQSVDSTVLNRVTGHITGGDMSRIMGTLESQGNVYILNPQGIFIGKDAVINVGSLIASTLNITNADFFNGKEAAFAGDSSAKVLNLGTIKAASGDVHVIAYAIENEGSIEAEKGQVSLNACQEAILQPASNRRVLIKTRIDSDVFNEKNENESNAGVSNTGVIKALEVRLGAEGSLYKLAINQSGHIEAKTLTEEGGKIFLTAEKGAIQVDGILTAKDKKHGGSIEVMGDSIRLEDRADIDVSGSLGGGTILIGSDYQGKGMPFNSQHTYIAAGAKVTASALENGNGGKIIFWGDESMEFLGNVKAEGGSNGGDGGFVEVSSPGKQPGAFKVVGLVTTLAPKGKTGTLLWDPDTITVTTEANTLAPSGNTYSGASGNIQASLLETNLGSNNIVIDAGVHGRIEIGPSTGATDGALFTWTTNKLTLQTNGNGTVQFYQGITGDVGSSLEVNTKTCNIGLSDHSQTNEINVIAATTDINLNANNGVLGIYGSGTAATSGKDAILGQDLGSALTINISDGAHTGCQMTLSTASNASALINAKNAIDINVSGNIKVEVVGDVDGNAAIYSDTGAIDVVSTTGAITLSSRGDGNSNVYIWTEGTGANGLVTVTASRDITLENTDGDTTDTYIFSKGGAVDVESTGGAVTLSNGGSTLSNVYIRSEGTGVHGTVSVKAAKDIRLATANDSTTGTIYIQGLDGAVDVESTGGAVTLSNGGDDAGELFIRTIGTGANGNISVKAAKDITIESINSSGRGTDAYIHGMDGALVEVESTEGKITLSNSGARNSDVYIENGGGTVSVIAARDIKLESLNPIAANANTYILSADSMSVDSREESIILSNTTSGDSSSVYIKDEAPGQVLVKAGKDLQMSGNSYVNGASVIVVTDNLYPSPSGNQPAGSGHLTADAASYISTTGNTGNIYIFSGHDENNRIHINGSAEFNGTDYQTVKGVEGVQNANNRFDIYYNASALPAYYGAPVTFYYKGERPVIPAHLVEGARQIAWSMIPSYIISSYSGQTLINLVRKNLLQNAAAFGKGIGRSNTRTYKGNYNKGQPLKRK